MRNNFLRWYQYIICAVSLQSLTWAVIALLRGLLVPLLNPSSLSIGQPTDTIALQLALIIIALPLFVVHWLWAEKTPSHPTDELVRPLYLYLMIGAFLIPFLSNSFGFIASILRLILAETVVIPSYSSQLPDQPNLIYTAIALLILGLLWFLHRQLAGKALRSAAAEAPIWIIRRLTIYLFSLGGLTAAAIALINLLRWLLAQNLEPSIGRGTAGLIQVIALLLTALPLWLIAWRRAQINFLSGTSQERRSLLRKSYIYFVILIASLSFVTSATTLLAGLLRRLLTLPPQEGSSTAIAVLLVAALLWAYHALVLRDDYRLDQERERQATLRRLYWYLIAAVGFSAFIIGIAGLISLLITSSGQLIVSSDREQLAWFSAALISGLIVWIIPWLKIQRELPQKGARQETVRKLYLYFFILLATLSFLSGMVFLLSQFLSALFAARSTFWDQEMSTAAAYAVLAVLVWLYHGFLLRRDRQALDQQFARRVSAVRLVIIKDEEQAWIPLLARELKEQLPHLNLDILSKSQLNLKEDEDRSGADSDLLAQADLIIGQWTIAATRGGGADQSRWQTAVSASPATKLLLPHWQEKWQWSGVQQWDDEAAVAHTINAVKQFIAAEPITLQQPRSSAAMILIALVVLSLLFLFLVAVLSAF